MIMEHEIFFEEGINYAEDLFWNAQFLYPPFRTRGLQTTQAHRQENLEIIKLEAKKMEITRSASMM